VLEGLFWQIGGFGPMRGRAHQFNKYALERYTNEVTCLYNVLDKRLEGREYVAEDYSIADISVFPWCRLFKRQGQDIEKFPNVKRGSEHVAARPAVACNMDRLEDKAGEFDEQAWSNLFGTDQ